jgi:hypothetical protein
MKAANTRQEYPYSDEWLSHIFIAITTVSVPPVLMPLQY